MKISIKYRLFLAMLAATALVVVCMFLILQWSVDRGFLRYVNTIEEARLEQLAGDIERAYAEHGSWEFLKDNRPRMARLLAGTLSEVQFSPERLSRMERRMERRDQVETDQPPRYLPFERRIVLLDAGRNPVFAPLGVAGDFDLRPLRQGNRTVGFLGLQPNRHLADAHQLRFVKQQKLAIALAGVIMLIVSASLALPLANHLVGPVRSLAAATNQLASGRYATRVNVTSTDELGQLARDFNSLALALEQNEGARRQWIADISHELRTPLAVLRGEIEALQDGIRQPTSEAIGSLHGEVLRLSRLVDDLFQLALSDVGALTYRKTDLDLAEELAEAVESYRPRFAGKGLALTVDFPSGTKSSLLADPERLRQLFDNLLENSLKYTDPGGRLHIRLETRGGRAFIDFQDSAPGVADSDMEKIFDRLYRVDHSRSRASGGAGLGLAICRNIVEGHDGSIKAQSSPWGGLWIHLTLPMAG
jgi:two-component system, OmpR family, sensor histidine kinase BaeS